MITVRTRSSRFFVVLLHLVGVSTHLPSKPGIIGVHPWSIVLETVDPSQLEHLSESTDSSARIMNKDGQPRQHLHQPHWLQDVLGDQACLHPMGGFSDCGDATLWLVIPKKSSKRQARWRQWITWATEEEETDENTSSSRIQGYALQLYEDVSHHYHHHTTETEPTITITTTSSVAAAPYRIAHSPTTSNLSEKECLTRRRKDNQLVLVPCSQNRAWAWHFNEYGILYFRKPKSKNVDNHVDEKQKKLIQKNGKKTLECLGRNSTNAAVLVPCDGSQTPSAVAEIQQQGGRVLQIGLVRQYTGPSRISTNKLPKGEPSTIQQEALSHPAGHFPPSQIGKAHTHAAVSNGQRETLKGATRIASLSSHKTPPVAPSETTLSLSFFKSVNPILLASGNMGLAPEKEQPTTNAKKAMDPPYPLPSPLPTRPLIRNKIQTNPYVNDSVDERWTDPQTQLVYHTDLCHYLGHNRRDAGRHTLTGVGQYMKTVFNIKVRFCPPFRSQENAQ